jgi:hypothetical protein
MPDRIYLPRVIPAKDKPHGLPLCWVASVIPVTEVNLARVPRALEGEVRGGSSLEGAGKGRLWRKGSRKGVD